MKKHVLAAFAAISMLSFYAAPASAGDCALYREAMGEVERALDAFQPAAGNEKAMNGLQTRIVDSGGTTVEHAHEQKFAMLETTHEMPALHLPALHLPADAPASARRAVQKYRGAPVVVSGAGVSSDGTGYSPRAYHSQYYMPRSGNRSRPEEATR